MRAGAGGACLCGANSAERMKAGGRGRTAQAQGEARRLG